MCSMLPYLSTINTGIMPPADSLGMCGVSAVNDWACA